MKSSRKLIVYIACSLDGIIAKPNDDLSFLKMVETQGEDYGYANFTQSVDTSLMGRKTYDWLSKQGYDLPHPEKQVFIITSQTRPNKGHVEFYTGNLETLVSELKNHQGKTSTAMAALNW